VYHRHGRVATVLARSERVPAGNRHPHRFLQQGVDGTSLLMGDGPADESNVDLVVYHAFDEVVGGTLFQRQGHQRKGLPELANDTRRQGMERGRVRTAHGDSALFASRCALGRVKCLIEETEHSASVIEKSATSIRELNTPRLASK